MENKHVVFDKNASLMIKGVAIIMMVFHHGFRLTNIYSGFQMSFFPFTESNIVNIASASKICVSLFVFVSGYGLYLSFAQKKATVTAQKWVLYRCLKLFSKYWFVWALIAIMCQVIDKQTGRLFFLNGIDRGIVYCMIDVLGLSTIFHTPTLNSVWWYMGAALTFIMATPLIYKCKQNLMLLMACTLLFPRVLLGHDGTLVSGSGMSAFSFMGQFLIGCIFAEYGFFDAYLTGKPKSILEKAVLFCLELWGIIFLYKLYHHMDRAIFWEIHYIIFPSLCIAFLVKYVFVIRPIQKILMFFGRYSMNIYLIHSIVQRYLKSFVFSCGHFIAVTLLMLAISALLSIIINWLMTITRYNAFIEKSTTKLIN